MNVRRIRTVAGVVIFMLASVVRADAQDSIDTARQLYAAAEYEAALTTLDGLRASAHPDEEQRTIDLYRILCLVATDREPEARGAIEALVMQSPLYRPTDDLPPRIRTTFMETRRRLIPAAVQGKYQAARAAFDFKDYRTAERSFASVLELLDDAEVASLIGQTPLADLRTLVTGFHDLSRQVNLAAAPAAQAPESGFVAPPVREVVRTKKIYSIDDVDVVPPSVVEQRIPSFPGTVRAPQSGVIEVVIDRDGSVQSATMLETVNPQYDRIALNAARSWHYQPATRGGVPVMFLKRIQVNLVPGN